MLGWGILGLIAWIIIAFWPARVASRKGHSFLGYFILSLFFWWITLFVVYFGLKDKNETTRDRASEKAAEKVLEQEEKAA
jgi:phosphotransferase system  glucose/maltose/N-acetylglucosamine-specific IIC component